MLLAFDRPAWSQPFAWRPQARKLNLTIGLFALNIEATRWLYIGLGKPYGIFLPGYARLTSIS